MRRPLLNGRLRGPAISVSKHDSTRASYAATVEPRSVPSPSCPPQLSAGEITEDAQQQLPTKRRTSDAPVQHQAASLGNIPLVRLAYSPFDPSPLPAVRIRLG
ncbi:hypothetical protein ILYODFUR_032972 [Ilyodon furcidens]|uniref:Uncharacterized protein n=1 Tax=Ilyodon furcidens TaxID=33524 RepID=A0ABV0TD14_9TELE